MKYLSMLLFVFSVNANAALMDPIDANGRLWLQPIDFQGLTWNDISAVCNPVTGICNGSLNGHNMAGWAWASIDDLNALFNYYIGSPQLGPGPDAYITQDTSLGVSFFADGWVPNSSVVPGSIDVISFLRESPTSAAFFSLWASAGLVGASTTPDPSVAQGGWFTNVPSPTTSALTVLALFGLVWSRRQAARQNAL